MNRGNFCCGYLVADRRPVHPNPGAHPVESDGGRLLFAVRDRGYSHLWDDAEIANARRWVGFRLPGALYAASKAEPFSCPEQGRHAQDRKDRSSNAVNQTNRHSVRNPVT